MTVPTFDMDVYVRNPQARQPICISKAELQVSADNSVCLVFSRAGVLERVDKENPLG
jgi:hypothetical protein